MKKFVFLVLVVGFLLGGMTGSAFAADKDPLLVNLTSDDPHRAKMGISFGKGQMDRGHPLTIFLNDKSVQVGSTAHAARFAEHHALLADLMAKGATVMICPMCMKYYGVQEGDLLPGLQVSNPELTGAALFQDGARVMSW